MITLNDPALRRSRCLRRLASVLFLGVLLGLAAPHANAQGRTAQLLSAPLARLASFGADPLHDFDDLNVVLDSVRVSPDPIPGGASAVGTVKLRFPLFIDVVVFLSNTNPAVSIPDRVTIKALDRTATFPVTARPVTRLVSGKIGGMIQLEDRVTQSGSKFSVRPAGVQGVTFNPARVRGGQFASGVVTLEAPLASGPATVTLAVSSSVGELSQTTLTIPAGETLATFTVDTQQVATETPATVTATVNGVTRTGTLVVTP